MSVPWQNATVHVTVRRGGGSIGNVSVPVQAIGGTGERGAKAGVDFLFSPTTLAFADGTTSQTVAFTIIDDTIPELDEAFVLVLLAPSRGRIAEPAKLTVVISSNDNAAGVFQFAAAVANPNVQVRACRYTVGNTAAWHRPHLRP